MKVAIFILLLLHMVCPSVVIDDASLTAFCKSEDLVFVRYTTNPKPALISYFVQMVNYIDYSSTGIKFVCNDAGMFLYQGGNFVCSFKQSNCSFSNVQYDIVDIYTVSSALTGTTTTNNQYVPSPDTSAAAPMFRIF